MENQPALTQPQASQTSVLDLIKAVLADDKLEPKQKVYLIDEIRKNNPSPMDRWVYRWAIWILGAGVLLTILFVWHLASNSTKDNPINIPDSLVAIGSTLAGGIVGILAPTGGRTSSSDTV